MKEHFYRLGCFNLKPIFSCKKAGNGVLDCQVSKNVRGTMPPGGLWRWHSWKTVTDFSLDPYLVCHQQQSF